MDMQEHKPTVVITGSSGLIGERIAGRLASHYRLIGMDVKPPESDSQTVEFIETDFTDDQSVRRAFDTIRTRYGSKLASVLHLAAYYDFNGKDSPLYEELTVEGTRRLCRALHQFDDVDQLVFSSSLLVMKPCELGEKLNEHSPTRAEWAYPESKLAAEKVIEEEAAGISTVNLRLAGVYDEDGHSLPICQNIRRVAEKEFESYLFPGDAERGQAFIHLDDVSRCFELVVERRNVLGKHEMFLIAEDECLSYEVLQDMIGEQLHGVDDWPTIRIPKAIAKAGAWAKEKMAASEEEAPFIKPWMVDLADAHYPVDNTRARTLLKWEPQHRLSETLPEMIRRLKENPRRWYEVNKLPPPDDWDDLPRATEGRDAPSHSAS